MKSSVPPNDIVAQKLASKTAASTAATVVAAAEAKRKPEKFSEKQQWRVQPSSLENDQLRRNENKDAKEIKQPSIGPNRGSYSQLGQAPTAEDRDSISATNVTSSEITPIPMLALTRAQANRREVSPGAVRVRGIETTASSDTSTDNNGEIAPLLDDAAQAETGHEPRGGGTDTYLGTHVQRTAQVGTAAKSGGME